ncbi:MAG: hypothetical protein AAF772_11030 [Acidobacteriota bacterium]
MTIHDAGSSAPATQAASGITLGGDHLRWLAGNNLMPLQPGSPLAPILMRTLKAIQTAQAAGTPVDDKAKVAEVVRELTARGVLATDDQGSLAVHNGFLRGLASLAQPQALLRSVWQRPEQPTSVLQLYLRGDVATSAVVANEQVTLETTRSLLDWVRFFYQGLGGDEAQEGAVAAALPSLAVIVVRTLWQQAQLTVDAALPHAQADTLLAGALADTDETVRGNLIGLLIDNAILVEQGGALQIAPAYQAAFRAMLHGESFRMDLIPAGEDGRPNLEAKRFLQFVGPRAQRMVFAEASYEALEKLGRVPALTTQDASVNVDALRQNKIVMLSPISGPGLAKTLSAFMGVTTT